MKGFVIYLYAAGLNEPILHGLSGLSDKEVVDQK